MMLLGSTMVRRIVYPPAVCMLGNIHTQPVVGAAGGLKRKMSWLWKGMLPIHPCILCKSCTSIQFGHKWFKKIYVDYIQRW